MAEDEFKPGSGLALFNLREYAIKRRHHLRRLFSPRRNRCKLLPDFALVANHRGAPVPRPLIALKPYLDQIRQACEKCSHDDLVAAILKLAAARPPGAREAFLIQIRTILRKDRISTPPADESAELLAEIDALVEQVSQRMDAINDGSIYEEPDDWEDEYEERDYGWDDDPPPMTDAHRQDAETLFARVDGLFLDRQFATAAKAYGKLLKLFEMDYVPDLAVPVEEARAILPVLARIHSRPQTCKSSARCLARRESAVRLAPNPGGAEAARDCRLRGWRDFLVGCLSPGLEKGHRQGNRRIRGLAENRGDRYDRGIGRPRTIRP
jgi:hypothetical protein